MQLAKQTAYLVCKSSLSFSIAHFKEFVNRHRLNLYFSYQKNFRVCRQPGNKGIRDFFLKVHLYHVISQTYYYTDDEDYYYISKTESYFWPDLSSAIAVTITAHCISSFLSLMIISLPYVVRLLNI